MRRAVFLDRDGVLNRNVLNPATSAYESPLTPEQFELLPQVVPALQLLRDADYLLFLVSNQPNYAKGKASMRVLQAIHRRLEATLAEGHISLAACYYCYHHPAFTGQCVCRKPSPHFLFKARDAFGIELAHSWMVGDRQTDIECGRAAGARTLEISGSPGSKTDANQVAADLWSAARVITSELGR